MIRLRLISKIEAFILIKTLGLWFITKLECKFAAHFFAQLHFSFFMFFFIIYSFFFGCLRFWGLLRSSFWNK